MRKRIMFLAATVLATFAILGSGTAWAAGDVGTTSWEVNTAVQHDMTEYDRDCITGGGSSSLTDDVRGCVMPYGDILWLDDLEGDGYGVKLKWWDTNGTRAGVCNANQGVNGGWARCNKDLPEGHVIKWYVSWYEGGSWHRNPGSGWYIFTKV